MFTLIPALKNQYSLDSLRIYQGDYTARRPGRAVTYIERAHSIYLKDVRCVFNERIERPVFTADEFINEDDFATAQHVLPAAEAERTPFELLARKLNNRSTTVFQMYPHLAKKITPSALLQPDVITLRRFTLQLNVSRWGNSDTFVTMYPTRRCYGENQSALTGAEYMSIEINWSRLSCTPINPTFFSTPINPD
jgi:hypothetical protein